jgi:hypothetical protein
MDGARLRALDIKNTGQSASPALSTLILSTPAVARTLPPHQFGVRDTEMDNHDKENMAGEAETPVTLTAEDKHQTRSPAKPSTQTESRQSNFPLGPAATPLKSPAQGLSNINPGSRSSSPVKTPRSRPPSRPSSPLKRTPAPGKNEHFETTPTGFRYTIELPESKIVPKKDSGTTPSKPKTSTPVKKFILGDVASKHDSPKRARSPTKSASPRKELLKTRAVSPEKKAAVAGVKGAEPTPTDAAPKSHRKRDPVLLTKTNGVHSSPPTVEVTKGDTWTSVQLTSTSEKGNVETQAMDLSEGERRTGVDGPYPSPASIEYQEKPNVNKVEAAVVPPKKQSIPTNFGEMLRNSSKHVLQRRSSLHDEPPEMKHIASPTVMDKARRNSEIHARSLVEVMARPNFKGSALTKDPVVVKDFTNGDKQMNKDLQGESCTEARKSSTGRRVSFASTPRTPTGTPPALMAAMEADMHGIRSSLRQSLGNGYMASPRSPDITRQLGSSENGRSPPEPSLATDTTNVGDTPRLNLKKRMAAAKQSILSKSSPRSKKAAPAPLTMRPKDKAEPRSPFHSRLPRLSPTKPKTPRKAADTVPQSPHIFPFDVPHTTRLAPSSVPAMASHRVRYARLSEKKGEPVGFASAEEIAKQVEEWNSETHESKASANLPAKTPTKTPIKATRDRSKGGPGFMRPTTTSAKNELSKENNKDTETYTPPGSPLLPQSPYTTHALLTKLKHKASPRPAKKPVSPLKNSKVRAVASATPRTPVPRSKGASKALDYGAVRTPSKEMVSRLDKEIDAHLEREARAGRIFTPSGQRISDLLAKRRESDGAREGEDGV